MSEDPFIEACKQHSSYLEPIGKASAPRLYTPRTCDSCRHWGASEAQEWHGDAKRPGRKFCGCPKITDGAIWNDSEFTPDMASAVDCEHYHAFLQTGPKFGCVHHEPKDP